MKSLLSPAPTPPKQQKSKIKLDINCSLPRRNSIEDSEQGTQYESSKRSLPNITSKFKDIGELHRQILSGAMTKTNANF